MKEYPKDPPESDLGETQLPVFAMMLLIMCGFGHEEFELTSVKINFEIGGKSVNSKVDAYVSMHTGSDQVVLVWEDKLLNKADSKVGAQLLQDSTAQIGEMLSVHWRNNSHRHEPCEVYAVCFIDDMVTFFKMDMSTEQIETVFKDGVIPDPKLQVGFTPMHALDAGKKYGMSLLDPDNRLRFVRMMACIRAKILERKAEPSVPFHSLKSGKDADLMSYSELVCLHRSAGVR